MKRYVGSYSLDGTRLSVTVDAHSWADAENRIRYVEPFGDARIDGELIADIPVNLVTLSPVGIVARLWCWARNRGKLNA